MRILSAVCVTLLFCGLALGQVPNRGYAGYVYGPYVPLVTTPQVSLETVSPAPVGASNATYGLAAGARNSTFETVPAEPNSTYTQPVWNAGGGAPAISGPEVSLFPRRLHTGAGISPYRMRMEEGRRERVTETRAWTYYAAPNETASAAEASTEARSAKKAARTYTNQDVEQENQHNGVVKYDNKTEKLQ